MTDPIARPFFHKVLVAVDDSPAALAAARAGIDFAVGVRAHLRFVHVTSDGEVLRALADRGRDNQLATRRNKAAVALLHHVGAEAERAGIRAETKQLNGDPAAMVLAEASDWGADLLVIGRSDVRGAGRPYVGTVTRHVLELVDIPVLVVPRPG
jgi:nucleotide-binding universal stress UspA family protein